MTIIFFAHPNFIEHQSMPRFAKFLSEGMCQRTHDVEIWSPDAKAVKLVAPQIFKKWLGYIDQFYFFPKQVRKRLKNTHANTLFVFTDHALGPWVPLVSNKPHVIHCHDFLAQKSAINLIPENPTGWTGKQYQKLIRWGYSKGHHFISVSKRTQQDLHDFLPSLPMSSKVIYNGLNQSFVPQPISEMRGIFGNSIGIDLHQGYILHVGGNQWYKNRTGIIEIYNAWRNNFKSSMPLILIGAEPNLSLKLLHVKSHYKQDIHFISNVSDDMVKKAYAGASVFLFPSIAEGFGWPIAEAMASGCPVITTDEAPMTEVADSAGFYIEKRPSEDQKVVEWSLRAAKVLNQVISLSSSDREQVISKGLENAKRFDQNLALDSIENSYKNILINWKKV
jgi:glycosyltransferase involved in cell wall biosynthesis